MLQNVSLFLIKLIIEHLLIILDHFCLINCCENTKKSVLKNGNFKNFKCDYLSCNKTELRGSKKKRQKGSLSELVISSDLT